MSFEFDEEKHIYTLDGIRLWSVTEILEDGRLFDPKFYTEESRIRGQRVHALCQFLDENDYDKREAERFGLDGYVESWRKFRDRMALVFLDIEKPLYHPLYRYAGRPDRRATFGGWEYIIDLKSGPSEKWHGLQTAAYDMMFGTYTRGLRKRCGVHLQEDGSEAVPVPHSDMNDGNYFLAFLTATKRREAHGLASHR